MTIRFHRLGKSEEDRAGMSRRMFLMTTTMAGVTTNAMLGGASFAASKVLDEAQGASLLRMIEAIRIPISCSARITRRLPRP